MGSLGLAKGKGSLDLLCLQSVPHLSRVVRQVLSPFLDHFHSFSFISFSYPLSLLFITFSYPFNVFSITLFLSRSQAYLLNAPVPSQAYFLLLFFFFRFFFFNFLFFFFFFSSSWDFPILYQFLLGRPRVKGEKKAAIRTGKSLKAQRLKLQFRKVKKSKSQKEIKKKKKKKKVKKSKSQTTQSQTLQQQMAKNFWQQTWVLMKKDMKMKRQMLWYEVLYPCLFMGILLAIYSSLKPQEFPPIESFDETSLNPTPLPSPLFLCYLKNASQPVQPVMDSLFRLLGPSFGALPLPFDDQDTLGNFLSENGTSAWAGLILDLEDPSRPAYTIRMADYLVPSPTQIYNLFVGSCRGNQTSCPATNYVSSQFLLLQRYVNRALFETLVGETNSTLPGEMKVRQMGKGAGRTENIGLSITTGIYVVVALSPILQNLLVGVVLEKERKFQDLMVMMGMKPAASILAWSLTTFATILLVVLVSTLIVKFGGLFALSDFFLIFFAYLLYGISTVAFCFVLSPFIGNSKVAGISFSSSSSYSFSSFSSFSSLSSLSSFSLFDFSLCLALVCFYFLDSGFNLILRNKMLSLF